MFLSFLRKLTLHYPILHPRASLLNKLPDVPANQGTFIAKKGIKYSAYPLEDYIVKNLFWFGEFEPWVTNIIGILVETGDVVCDVGANIGDTALQVFPFVGSSGHIYSFEPVPYMQECFNENIKANHISSITLIPKALSNTPGTLNMMIMDSQPGWSKIVDNNFSDHEVIQVPVTTFDLWLDEINIPQIDVCKIDVEGHELEVLEGMKKSISSGRVGSIVFERYMDYDPEDPVINFLNNNNYKVLRIYKSFRHVKAIENLKKNNNSFRGTADFVAVLRDSKYERRLKHLPE